MRIAVIIPALNESEHIEAILEPLQAWRNRGHSVCLVDGGSRDNTVELAQPLVDKVILSEPGRSLQMNTGSEQTSSEILLFLHADTVIGADDDACILLAVEQDAVVWGRFKVRFSSPMLIFRVIAFMMNIRSCVTSIATGDQGIFVRRDVFEQIGRFPQQELMEDIELSKRLRKLKRTTCLPCVALTSSRRWEKAGIVRTVLQMWLLRLAYFIGFSPGTLAKYYK